MKPHSILLTAICLPLLLVMGACKPDKTKDPITITYKLGEVKDYMVFKPGTYWVYQNDITGEIDSQWVTSCQVGEYSQKGTEEYSRHITLKQEFFEMYIATNFIDGYGDNPRWKVSSWGQKVNAYPSPDYAYVARKTKTANKTGGTAAVYGKPYYMSDKKEVFQISLLTNYELNGSTYDTVRVFRVGADWCFPQSKIPSLDGGNSDYYYAKNVGVIKIYNPSYRVSDGVPLNQTWSLIRKNIVQ
jgi:hypothetical protein